ncbi:MAG: hypothetical protein R3A52_30210 [Polyangiales bacterium]
MRAARITASAVASIAALGAGCRRPARPRADASASRDAGSTSVITPARSAARGCPATDPAARRREGTLHADAMRGHEVWTAAGSPHRAPHGMFLMAGARLALEPCALVLVGEGRDVVVQDGATLVSEGEPGRPVRFDAEGDAPPPGAWRGVEVRRRANPETRFVWTHLDHAGAPAAERGDPPAGLRVFAPSLRASHLAVASSGGWGVALQEAGAFSDDAGPLTVRGAREGAVTVADVSRVSTLPLGDYRGNARDEVRVELRDAVLTASARWRDLGVRYRVPASRRLRVEGADAPALTLDPGVTVAFDDDAALEVGWRAPGALVAVGDGPDARVSLVAAGEGARPRWVGVLFGPLAVASTSRLRWARIEGAGRPSGAFLPHCAPAGPELDPDRAMVTFASIEARNVIRDTLFVAGPTAGVAVLWAGDREGAPEDVTAPSHGNEFDTNSIGCPQSWARVGGACPVRPSCARRP